MLIGFPAPPRYSAPGRGGAARAAAIAAAFAVVAAAGSACGGGDAAADGDDAAGGAAAPAAESAEAAFSDGVPTGFPLPSGARRLGSARGGGTVGSPFVASFEVSGSGADVTAWLREALPASGFRIVDDDATTSVSPDYEQVASWALQKEGTGVLTTLLVREYPDGSTRLVLRSTKI